MRRIAVVGLGYVGLPVALAFSRRFPGTLGYDRDARKVERLARGELPGGLTSAVDPDDLARTELAFSADPADLAPHDLYVLALPTPIDEHRRPDLSALLDAAATLGPALSPGDVVVVESTVYPGATEEVVGPALERASGLRVGRDLRLGYSPERINPGDPAHSLERVAKVIAAQDDETLAVLRECYGSVVAAGLHAAPSIRVAEAAKVIENVQRDLNIALVNELALLFDRLDLDTRAVLEAAGTKWNFHPYRPGLVGGHCIGVDPYYLTSKAETAGFHPQIVLAGRRINDGMGPFVASRTIRLLIEAGRGVKGSRVAVLGLAFKPDVGDVRNSRVLDVVRELEDHGVETLVHDPLVEPEDARSEHGLTLASREALTGLDAVVLATPHRVLCPVAVELVRAGASVLVDPMWGVEPEALPEGTRYWRL